MVPFNIYCGSCCFCARGLYSNCHNVNPNATAAGGIYGYRHTCGGYDGGQAGFVRNGHLKPGEIVRHRIPLGHIAEGHHIFPAKLDNCIKTLVVPTAA